MIEKREDPRNLIDYYKYWKEDAVKADMREKCHNFSVLITNKFNDFNIGSVIRNSNAFCAKEVVIYGSKQYDKRGTVGAHLYTNMKHLRFVEDLKQVIQPDTLVVGFDNYPEALPIESFQWPTDRHVLMCFGQETTGLTEEIVGLCDHLLYIEQYGSVRSLNVGCASAIAMYDYCRKIHS